MKNLNINQCLFHGIRPTSNQSSIEILENILKTRYILTCNSLRGIGIFHEREYLGYQGLDAVSVCFHPNNINLLSKFKNVGIELSEEAPGFNQFVDSNNPSIIFSSELLNKLNYRKFGGYKRMTDEIQILDDIPLEEMIAIGYGDVDINYQQEKIYNIEKIRNLLNQYNYNIPIINPFTGSEYKKK